MKIKIEMTSSSKLTNALPLIWTSVVIAIFPRITNQLPATSYDKMPWYDAYLSCSMDGYHLPVPRASDLSDLHLLLPDQGPEEWMWIGGRSVHTRWQWSDGCRVERDEGCVEIRELSPATTTVADSPFDCLIRCQTTFVALQGSQCFCLDRKPTTFTTTDHCHLRCADNFLQRCGGIRQKTNYSSVYRRQKSAIEWDPEDVRIFSDNCAYIRRPLSEIPTLDDLHLATGVCDYTITTDFKQPLCRKCSAGNDTCDVFRNNTYQTWLQAREFCAQQGGELLNVRILSQPLPLIMHPYYPENYWVALWRDRLHMWIDGTKLNAVEFSDKSGFCMAARRGASSNTVEINTRDCSDILPFLCLNVTDMEVRFDDDSSQPPDGTCSDSETSLAPMTTSSNRFPSSTGTPAPTANTGYSTSQPVQTSPASTASLTSQAEDTTRSSSAVTADSHTGLGSSVPVSTTSPTRLPDSTTTLTTNVDSTLPSTADDKLFTVQSSEVTITTSTPEPAIEAQSTTDTEAKLGNTTFVTSEARETTPSRSTMLTTSAIRLTDSTTKSTTNVDSSTNANLSTFKSSETTFTASTEETATEAMEVSRPTEMTYADPKNSTPNQKVEPVEPTPDDDFLPLYIVIGILVGLALALIAIAVAVYKWRSRRRHNFRRREREDSKSEWVLQESPSPQSPRSEQEIESDPTFRFVETR